jgi:hypothetical protein
MKTLISFAAGKGVASAASLAEPSTPDTEEEEAPPAPSEELLLTAPQPSASAVVNAKAAMETTVERELRIARARLQIGRERCRSGSLREAAAG